MQLPKTSFEPAKLIFIFVFKDGDRRIKADRRASVLEYACLLARDLFYGRTESVGVVITYRADRSYERIAYSIGRIEPSAETYFEHCDIYLLLCKIQETQRCDELELGGMLIPLFCHLNRCLPDLFR